MHGTKPPAWSWLRIGGTVVAAIAGVLLVWMIALTGTAWTRSRSERVERRSLEQEVPGSRVGPSSTLGDSSGGRVVLDFAVGHFSIEPGEPGEPIRVEAAYDVKSYALEARFEPSDGAGWSYRVTFHEIGWLRDGGLRGVFGGAYPEVRVYLPPDVPFTFEGHFGKGVTGVELGGLWLTGIDLDVEKGAFDLSIGQPLVDPVDVIRIRGAQGSLDTRSLGNASPSELEIDFRMGWARIDLRGHWRDDADVRVRNMMGAAEIVLPGYVQVEGLGRRPILVSRELEVPPPTLRMSVSRFIARLSVIE